MMESHLENEKYLFPEYPVALENQTIRYLITKHEPSQFRVYIIYHDGYLNDYRIRF